MLPILVATILAEGPVQLRNVPELRDVSTMAKLLEEMVATSSAENIKWMHRVCLPLELRMSLANEGLFSLGSAPNEVWEGGSFTPWWMR